ncbi:MAG: Fe-S-containing protein [Dehalococcoidia bacterium]|nr:Fe-S-containing protein [Dehalococcoidia bacterium]
MGEALVITLREGIEAALVVGIILAYLRKTGKSYLDGKVYLGLVAAIAASIAFAIMFQALGINPENEFLEGTLFGIAGVLVASFVIWMWRVARKIREETERKLASVVSKEDRGAQGWGLFVFTFFMVFREGAETVLFLISATLGQLNLLSLVGSIIGIGLAVLFAVFFIRGSLRINLSRFFGVTSIVLLLLALKLILGSLHEFAEVGAIPMTKGLMAFIGYFVRDQTSMVLLMVLLAAPLLVILWDARSEPAVAAAEGERPVARRKRLAAAHQSRMWRFGLLAAALAILSTLGATIVAGNSFSDPEPVAVTAKGGEVNVPIIGLGEGKLAKFIYDSEGVGIRFLVVRLPDGSIATAMDACQICGKAGYGQDGPNALCKNCNAPIPMDTIGQGGGCNPLPLKSAVRQGAIVISIADLKEATDVFR